MVRVKPDTGTIKSVTTITKTKATKVRAERITTGTAYLDITSATFIEVLLVGWTKHFIWGVSCDGRRTNNFKKMNVAGRPIATSKVRP